MKGEDKQSKDKKREKRGGYTSLSKGGRSTKNKAGK